MHENISSTENHRTVKHIGACLAISLGGFGFVYSSIT